MTHRERILAALQGRPVDRLPWVPRLDLWYNANRYCGTLPREWAGASLPEIIADLGFQFVEEFVHTAGMDMWRGWEISHVTNIFEHFARWATTTITPAIRHQQRRCHAG